MEFLDNLETLMKTNNISNLGELANKSGIADSTLRNFQKRNTNNIRLSTLKRLSEFFEVSLDFLVYGEETNTDNNDTQLTTNEKKLLTTYKQLNTRGQNKLLGYAEDLLDTGKYEQAKAKEITA